jgi:hypothetical protein
MTGLPHGLVVVIQKLVTGRDRILKLIQSGS